LFPLGLLQLTLDIRRSLAQSHGSRLQLLAFLSVLVALLIAAKSHGHLSDLLDAWQRERRDEFLVWRTLWGVRDLERQDRSLDVVFTYVHNIFSFFIFINSERHI